MSLSKLRTSLHQHGFTKMVSAINLGSHIASDVVVYNNRTAIGIAHGFYSQTLEMPVICLHKPEPHWTLPSFPSIILQINPVHFMRGPSVHIQSHSTSESINAAVSQMSEIVRKHQMRTFLYLDEPALDPKLPRMVVPSDAILIPTYESLAFAIGVSMETHQTVIVIQDEITADVRCVPMARNLVHIVACTDTDKIKKYYDAVYVLDGTPDTKWCVVEHLLKKCKTGTHAIIV